jgi:hypothetical protein
MVRFPRLSDYGRISWTASSLVALLKAVLVSGIVLIALLYDRPAQGLAIPSAYQPNTIYGGRLSGAHHRPNGPFLPHR